MDKINYEHSGLAEGKWDFMPLHLQLGNVGSEVSRAIKWQEKNKERSNKAVNRALELIDLTLKSEIKKGRKASLKEICRGREVLCDFFYGDNVYHSHPQSLMKYYDEFATMKIKGEQK